MQELLQNALKREKKNVRKVISNKFYKNYCTHNKCKKTLKTYNNDKP